MSFAPAAVHVDLDGASHIYRIHGWQYHLGDDRLFEIGLLNALDFFDRTNVRATLFVIAEDLDDSRKRELVKEAVNRGHDLASHSYTHRHLTNLDPIQKRREIFDSRERISSEFGVEVRGFRAPGFAVDQDTLELLDEAGYAYDSSLFPTGRFAPVCGVPLVSAFPHRPLENRPLLELPLPRHKPLPVPFHPCFSIVLGLWYFRLGLLTAQGSRAPFVLLFHLTDFSDPLRAHELRGWKQKFFTLSHVSSKNKLRRCEQMLNLVKRRYKVVDTLSLLAMSGEIVSDRVCRSQSPDVNHQFVK